MKRLLISALLSLSAASALAADVGVSISIGEPGFFGRIDIGNFPRPDVIYAEPRIIERFPGRRPIYLRVPPGHEKHWDKHCHEYNACGYPVYFVRDRWYNEVYAPQRRGERRDFEERRDDRRYRDEDRQGDDRRWEDRGNSGHDRGRGKGHRKDD